MAKTYKGSLSLEWYNKQKSILLRAHGNSESLESDIPAPKVNWINKDESLFYEIIDDEGRGLSPFWINNSDIRIKESRPLLFKIGYKAERKNKTGYLPGTTEALSLKEVKDDEPSIENILIKGDNLLALNTLKKMFSNRPDEAKIKVAYFDVPYNTDAAFEHYDDSLEHSEWLTMIRDRMLIVRELLREDGCLFVHLDDKEAAYCKVLLDEIFGRSNYCNQIVSSTNSAFGFKGTSNDLFKQANHILLYAKNKEVFNLKRLYVEKEYDSAYKYIFKDISLPESQWSWKLLSQDLAEHSGYESAKEAIKSIGENEFNAKLAMYAIENSDRVFRTASVSGGALLKRKKTILESSKLKDTIVRHPNDDMDYIFIGGERVLFYKERLIEIDGLKLPGEIITDIWTDISIEGIAKEGNVDFPKSKKPEKLLRRLLDLSSEPGDYVLDVFGGSGTTFAVAHKMSRKWIGVEIGKHTDTHIVPRLKAVILGADQSGISKSVNWTGGGSFKYYHLGPSIIQIGKDGTSDFNWSLGYKFIEESLLSSYDYAIVSDINFSECNLFPNKEAHPSVGIQQVGSRSRMAVVTLNPPTGKHEMMSYDELMHIYKLIKKKYSPEYVNVFTNRGIELAFDSKPDDLEVVKVPHAIFAELGK